jgi:hypothetical protein
VISAVLVLAVQAAAAGRAAARPWLPAPAARPWLPAPGGRRQVPASTARSWRSRFSSHAAGLREQVMRLLPAVSGRESARPLVPSGSPAGDCLAALDAVTAGLRSRFPALAGVSALEVAAHLSGGLWLAPPEPVLEFNASLFPVVAVSPS